jgi:hypothetical protein
MRLEEVGRGGEGVTGPTDGRWRHSDGATSTVAGGGQRGGRRCHGQTVEGHVAGHEQDHSCN